MTITNVKAMIAKGFTIGLVAAGLAIAAPTKANAQVRVGVQFGPPIIAHGYVRPYYAPPPVYGYYRPGFYGDRYAFGRHEEFLRHEERERFYHERGFYAR